MEQGWTLNINRDVDEQALLSAIDACHELKLLKFALGSNPATGEEFKIPGPFLEAQIQEGLFKKRSLIRIRWEGECFLTDPHYSSEQDHERICDILRRLAEEFQAAWLDGSGAPVF